MIRSTASKVMWVGRATVFLVGLAVILALVFGAASTALGANGQAWILGQGNVATAITSLGGAAGVNGPMLRIVNNDADANDTALTLDVQSGEAPMRVDSATKVTNLNADQLDGKDSTEIGVHGLERVVASSDTNSTSPKSVHARCPSGKVVVGSGFDIVGGKSGTSPNTQTDVVVDGAVPNASTVGVEAYEERLMSEEWHVRAYAICAKVP